MLFVPAVLLGLLPFADEVSAASFKVAIVGAGAGGSSASYWLALAKQRAASGTTLDITVYEKDSRVGGRSTTVYPYNDTSYAPIELGASIFTTGNRNMMRAATEFGFDLVQFTGAVPGTGIWDGEKFVYRTTNNGTADGLLFQERYQDGPTVSGGLIADFTAPYAKSYTPSLPQFSTIANYSEFLGFPSLGSTTLKSYLGENGVNANWINDYMTASARFNYGQDASSINGVAGMTSLAADTAYSVKTGNFKVFEQFLAKSGATVKLNTKVMSITRIYAKAPNHPQYAIMTKTGTNVYDAVIVAAPLPLTSLMFMNTPVNPASPSFPKVNYLHLYVTLLTTTTPALLPDYFKVDNSTALPGTILTTAEYGTQPEFNSIRYQATIDRNGVTEYVVKIFSKAEISDATLATLFGKGRVGWVYRKEWDAYPYYPPRSDYPPLRFDQGLYYVNAMEGLWSTMETETISSRNVVDLLSTELLGSGLCGAGGSKGPVTDSYVVGWDC